MIYSKTSQLDLLRMRQSIAVVQIERIKHVFVNISQNDSSIEKQKNKNSWNAYILRQEKYKNIWQAPGWFRKLKQIATRCVLKEIK